MSVQSILSSSAQQHHQYSFHSAPAPKTAGIPDPATVQKQRDAYLNMLEQQMKQGVMALDAQMKHQKEYLAAQAEQQKSQFAMQVDLETNQQQMALQQQYQEQKMTLQQQAGQQKSTLEQQSMQLILDYTQKKAEEEMQKQQYEMERQQQEMQMRLQSEMARLQGSYSYSFPTGHQTMNMMQQSPNAAVSLSMSTAATPQISASAAAPAAGTN